MSAREPDGLFLPDEPVLLRIPPHSSEAESSVLGSLLLSPEAWDAVGDLLTADDFYRSEHRVIFASISRLALASRPVDVITVFDDLRASGEADKGGGLSYLSELSQYRASAANIRHYATTVREKAILRRLIAVGDEISSCGFSTGGRPVPDVLDECEQKVLSIGEETAHMRQGFKDAGALVTQLLDRVQDLHDNPRDILGTSSGFLDLDRMTLGLQPGELIVLAARPSMGKTALAINIAEHVAIDERLPVAVFSLEMGAAQLIERVVGSIGRIDHTRLRTGRLHDDEWTRLSDASGKLSRAPLHIDDAGGVGIGELRASARRLSRKAGRLGLIVVDYIQLMSTSGSGDENRATAIGEISRGLKLLAKELHCPVIALSQLSRGVESRTNKRPMMSDLRESGAIEQDADVILFIYRDEYYNPASPEPGVAEIIISKQRSGPTGTVRLAFIKHLTRFENLAEGYTPPRAGVSVSVRKPYTEDV